MSSPGLSPMLPDPQTKQMNEDLHSVARRQFRFNGCKARFFIFPPETTCLQRISSCIYGKFIHPVTQAPKPQSWSFSCHTHIQLRSKPSCPLHWPAVRVTTTDSKLILFLPLAPGMLLRVYAHRAFLCWKLPVASRCVSSSHLPTHWVNEAIEWNSKKLLDGNTKILRSYKSMLWAMMFGVVCMPFNALPFYLFCLLILSSTKCNLRKDKVFFSLLFTVAHPMPRAISDIICFIYLFFSIYFSITWWHWVLAVVLEASL